MPTKAVGSYCSTIYLRYFKVFGRKRETSMWNVLEFDLIKLLPVVQLIYIGAGHLC